MLNNETSPYVLNFNSDGTYSRFTIQFSVSGMPLSSDLLVILDGVDLKFTPRVDVQIDRWFYEVPSPQPLSKGTHNLTFVAGPTSHQGVAQLCSVEILEYGNEKEWVQLPMCQRTFVAI